jgi:hypothetical protein
LQLSFTQASDTTAAAYNAAKTQAIKASRYVVQYSSGTL